MSAMEVDEVKAAPTGSLAIDESDSRQSLQHVLSNSDAPDKGAEDVKQEFKGREGTSKPTIKVDEPRSVQNDSYSRAADINPSHTMTVVHSRRNANGTIGSVYSGNKIRHLKKEDGVPLWREDIQYSFLRAVFENTDPVFTMDGDKSKKHNFADIYISAMAKSTKTSKVLREKLLSDRESALNMAMICLLVNVGRMNTTLNFFPEMRAQLRTYHSIPCLQVHQDSNSQYKGLQDAPRLKSILKGSCEDPNQPGSIEAIQAANIPRTNPVNLIFVMSQYAPKVSETHFVQPHDFFDLVIRKTWSSKSRATAFLWLMWWYLESDFSEEDSLRNPFGPGVMKEGDSLHLKVPEFEGLTDVQATAENVDTEEEKAYGEKMAIVRKKILEEDETVGPPLKKPAGRLGDSLDDKVGASPARSEIDRTRSPSPNTLPPLKMPKPRRLASAREQDLAESPDGSGRLPTRIILKASKLDRAVGSSSPAPGPMSMSANRRARPETSHQRAVNLNRLMRIESIMHRKLTNAQTEIRKAKKNQARNKSFVAMSRIIDLPAGYDSEDETAWGSGGIVPNPKELQDYGLEALANKKIYDRAFRRLGRQDAHADPQGQFTREYIAIQRKKQDAREEPPVQEERYKRPIGGGRRGGRGGRRSQIHREMMGTPAGAQDDQMNDVEMAMGGDAAGGEDESGDGSGSDDSGAGDDATEDEMVE